MLELTSDVFSQVLLLLDVSDAVSLLSSSVQLERREGVWPMFLTRDFYVPPLMAAPLGKRDYANRFHSTFYFSASAASVKWEEFKAAIKRVNKNDFHVTKLDLEIGCGLPDANPMQPGKDPAGFNSVIIHSFRFKGPVDYASRLVIKNAMRMLGQKLFEGKYSKVAHKDKLKKTQAHPVRFNVTNTHVHCAYYYNAKVIDASGYHGELETSFSEKADNCLDAFRKNLPLWFSYLQQHNWYSKDIHENLAATFHHFVAAYDAYREDTAKDHVYQEPPVSPKKSVFKNDHRVECDDTYTFRAHASRHKFEIPFALKELMDPDNCHMISIFGVIFDNNWKWYDNDFQFLIDWQDYIPHFSQLKYEKISVLPLTGELRGSIALHIPEPYQNFFQKTSALGRFVLSEKQLRAIRDGNGSGEESDSDSW